MDQKKVEARQIPLAMRQVIDSRIHEIFKQVDIKGFRVE